MIVLLQITGAVGTEGSPGKSYEFDVCSHRGATQYTEMYSPVQDGLVTDWDWFEKTWEYASAKFLKVDSREAPVLMSEKPYNSAKSRQRFFQLTLDNFAFHQSYIK
jgi:actin-related protein